MSDPTVHHQPRTGHAPAVELSLVLPCLNEAQTLETCLAKAQRTLTEGGIAGEIIVADNGSIDGSQEIARRNGARVVSVAVRGYGAALRGGIAAARGTYVIMGDADDSYDWSLLIPFLERLRAGFDLVMGSRLKGTILPGAMPWLHRWVGNPILTLLGNVFFNTKISDYHCGMRGFNREAVSKLGLQTTGMEFATEMVAKAAIARLSMSEIPIIYSPDGRTRRPHLRTWRDGWRHLRFMLILSPAWLLLYPGLLLFLLGAIGMALLIPGPLKLGQIGLDVHTLLVSGIMTLVGFQTLTLWFYSRIFAENIGLLPTNKQLERVRLAGSPLLIGGAAGLALIIGGIAPSVKAFILWADTSFGAFNYEIALRLLIPGLVLIASGVHLTFAGFFLELLNYQTSMNAGLNAAAAGYDTGLAGEPEISLHFSNSENADPEMVATYGATDGHNVP